MNLAIWIAIAAAILAASAPITQGGLRTINERQLGRYVAKAGLPLPGHLREPLLRRIAARERWAMNGGMIGLVLAAVAAFVVGWRDANGGAMVILGVAFGGSVGGVLAILFGRHQFAADAPRMARSQATELGDYLTRGELLTARLAPLAALIPPVVATVVMSLVPHGEALENRWWTAMTWACAGLTLVMWLGSEFTARTVLQQPQHAESRLELAWDDVCRAESLRGMFVNPVIMAVLTSMSSLILVGVTVIDPTVRAGAMELTAVVGMAMMGVSLVVVVALLTPGLLALVGPYRQQVLRQLWAGTDFTTDAREHSC